uniref:tripartite motif-containing protein 16-like protein n=1 Tax=Epinephelus lanceolatus TaxID=310571 RepID=UPI001446A629|nr:tripartite motif-containing protein 16-like protein [Epinephelus lanceolatus]
MAQQVIQLDPEKLSCLICLDLLNDPVTIPCGHSYCMSCIEHCWDEENGQHETYSCPQCRQSFTPRPVMMKSTMLAELVEEQKKVGLHAVSPDQSFAGPEDVACDFCSGIKLQQEITELQRKDTELEKLSRTEDHLHFLNNYPSLSRLRKSRDLPSMVKSLCSFKDVTAAVSEARDKLQALLNEEWTKISLAVTEEDVLLPQAEPRTRAEYMKYSHQITLDPNTAHTLLSLSDSNRKATLTAGRKFDSVRFLESWQVLSREGLTERCYWEVKWSGRVFIAVAYKDISRTGTVYECGFGYNDKSWSLECNSDSYEFRHNNIVTSISGPQSSTIGVYLDHRAGTLSYYSVSETMTLLHRVQTKFTQPLYAGFWLPYIAGSTAELCELK